MPEDAKTTSCEAIIVRSRSSLLHPLKGAAAPSKALIFNLLCDYSSTWCLLTVLVCPAEYLQRETKVTVLGCYKGREKVGKNLINRLCVHPSNSIVADKETQGDSLVHHRATEKQTCSHTSTASHLFIDLFNEQRIKSTSKIPLASFVQLHHISGATF